MQPPTIIRKATPADAAALAELAERTFRQAFAETNSAQDMALHCARTYGTAIQDAELQAAFRTTFVVDLDGALLAYAQLRSDTRHEAVHGRRPMEIQRFYVDAGQHGRGVAQDLMSRVVSEAAGAGADVVWLGVWERNERAQAFYRKWQFELVGKTFFLLGQDRQRDVVMRRAIEAPG